MALTGRIRLYALLVTVLLVFYSVGAVVLIGQLAQTTKKLVEVEEPLEDAAIQMGVNSGDTAVAVLSYLDSEGQDELIRLSESEAGFRQSADDFMQLAESDADRATAVKAEMLYDDLKSLGDTLIVDSQLLDDDFAMFQQEAAKVEAGLDNAIRAATSQSPGDEATKLEAAAAMELSIEATLGAVSTYLIDSDQIDYQVAEDSEDRFEDAIAMYRSTPLNMSEQAQLDQAERAFLTARTSAERIAAMNDQLKENANTFTSAHLEIRQFLQVNAEDPIHLRAEASRADTERLSVIAVAFVVATGALLLTTVGAVALAFGRTEKRREEAEEESRRSEENFLITLDSISDGVIATDARGAITRMNPVAESLTGWTLAEGRGRPLQEVFDCFSAQSNESSEDLLRNALKTGSIVGMPSDSILTTRDGTRLQVADSAAPVMGADGSAEGIVIVFRDVTEEFRTETQVRHQHKLESIGTLAGGVAHEINNPLYGIMNYAKLIDDRLEPESPLHEYAQEIGIESERVSEIVRSLLTFSRHDNEAHSPARMHDIVDGTLSLIRTIIRRDQITLEVDVPDDLPMLKCRTQQIQQVIMNLLTNGRDALNERYPEHDPDKILLLNVTQFNEGGRRWLRTTVEDHGSGIKPEVVERLFDPFFTTKDRAKGTGLGLSISHGIARSHHGRLWHESKPNKYTRFHLDLPVDNGWNVEP